MSFRPPGEKVSSYTRVAPNNATKGKGAVVTLPEDDPDAIVYEVYHVRASNTLVSPVAHSFDAVSGNMEDPGIPRISPPDATIHSALHRGWFLH